MTTEHLSSLAADPSLFNPSCLNMSIAATFIWLYPSFQAGQGRAGQTRRSNRPSPGAQGFWQHQLQFYGSISSSFMASLFFISLTSHRVSLHISCLLSAVVLHLPPAFGHERGLCAAVKPLIHLA